MKTSESRHQCHSGFFNASFKPSSHVSIAAHVIVTDYSNVVNRETINYVSLEYILHLVLVFL